MPCNNVQWIYDNYVGDRGKIAAAAGKPMVRVRARVLASAARIYLCMPLALRSTTMPPFTTTNGHYGNIRSQSYSR